MKKSQESQVPGKLAPGNDNPNDIMTITICWYDTCNGTVHNTVISVYWTGSGKN